MNSTSILSRTPSLAAPGISSRRFGHWTIARYEGSNDRNSQAVLFASLRAQPGRKIALEIAPEVADLNSGFVGLLVAAAREIGSSRGELVLLSPPPALRRLLAITGTTGVVRIAESELDLG